MTTDAKETRGDRVRAHLLAKYPCAILPFGVVTEIAEQFGVTRERVRQIAVGLGYPGYLSQTPEQRIVRGKQGRRLCPSCGNQFGRRRFSEDTVSRTLCPDCKWTDVACAECGKLKRVRTARYLWLLKNPRRDGMPKFTGAQFCDRVCFGRYMGKHVWFVAHPENAGGSRDKAKKAAATRRRRLRERVIAELTRPMATAEVYEALGVKRSDYYVVGYLKELAAEGRITCTVVRGRGSPRIWAPVQS